MTASRSTTIIAAISMAISALPATAQEKKISRSELPVAVEKTVSQQTKGATIRGFSRETENGKTIYEAELTVDGHSKDVSMDENGTVVEVEEQISLESLSPAVRESLALKAGKGKIAKVESLTKQGKLVAYEAKVQLNGKKSEIQVGPDGQALDHEE